MPLPHHPASDGHDPRRLWFECLVVLALAWLPHTFGGLMMFGGASAGPEAVATNVESIRQHYEQPVLAELWSSVGSLQVILPLMYIMWRSGEGWRAFGLGRIRWLGHTAWAIAGAAAGYAAYFLLAWLVYAISQATQTPDHYMETGASEAMIGRPQSVGLVMAATAMFVTITSLLLNSLAEEFAMRAVLMTRLKHLTGSTTVAVLVSTAVFASYHAYQGVYGLASSFAFGLAYALVFVRTGSIWPAVIAHTLTNLLVFLTA